MSAVSLVYRHLSVPLLLDANVLWSAALRDTLLLAAEEDLFRPVWTRQILQEMSRSLKARRPDLDPARFDRTVDQILTHFPEALVERYEHLIAECETTRVTVMFSLRRSGPAAE